MRYLLLVAAAKAQLILPLLERPYQQDPALQLRAFRLDSAVWALVMRIRMQEWADYAFDSLIPVQLRLYDAEGKSIAETLLTPLEDSLWQGYLRWRLPSDIANQWFYLEAFPQNIPEKAFYARCYFPPHVVSAYPLRPELWVTEPFSMMDTAGRVYEVRVGDSLWKEFFMPAQVDTAWPLLPYILTEYKPRWAYTPCAWHLRGDSSQTFWTCALVGPPPKKVNLNSLLQAEARRYFSGSKPGDRTDFGLIYATWGPPDLRLYTTSLETWVYVRQKISFLFDRRGQEWVLQRRIEYQAVWK